MPDTKELTFEEAVRWLTAHAGTAVWIAVSTREGGHLLTLAAILVVAAAVLGWINYKFLRLPTSVGLTVMGALASTGLLLANEFLPGVTLDDWIAALLQRMDFSQTLLQGMLSFLLFAGALHVDLAQLKKDWWAVLVLSTAGVLISTALIGARPSRHAASAAAQTSRADSRPMLSAGASSEWNRNGASAFIASW